MPSTRRKDSDPVSHRSVTNRRKADRPSKWTSSGRILATTGAVRGSRRAQCSSRRQLAPGVAARPPVLSPHPCLSRPCGTGRRELLAALREFEARSTGLDPARRLCVLGRNCCTTYSGRDLCQEPPRHTSHMQRVLSAGRASEAKRRSRQRWRGAV